MPIPQGDIPPHLRLNNLDLLDEHGTPNPHAAEGCFFDESPDDLTLDEIYAGASEEELAQLAETAFRQDAYDYQAALPKYVNHRVIKGVGWTDTSDIIENSLRYVVHLVIKRRAARTDRLSLLDRMQNGNIGLVEAAISYDKEMDVSLIAYANPNLLNKITRAESGTRMESDQAVIQGDLIRVRNPNNPYHRVRDVHEVLNGRFGRELDLSELCDLSDFTADELAEYADRRKQFVSFHRILDEDGEPIERFAGGYTDDEAFDPYERIADRVITAGHIGARKALSYLHSDVQRAVVAARLRLGEPGQEPLEFKEIAAQLGCSHQNAQQVYAAAIERLRSISRIREIISGPPDHLLINGAVANTSAGADLPLDQKG